MKSTLTLLASILVFTSPSHADLIKSGTFQADLDPAFPALRSYSYQGNTTTLPAGDPVLLTNGQKPRPHASSPSRAIPPLPTNSPPPISESP